MQIIMESTTPAVLAVETAIAMAADASDDTWLDRLQYITEEELQENADSYVESAKGQDVAPSSAMQYIMLEYGDTALKMADQWEDVNVFLTWDSDTNAYDDSRMQ